MSVIKEAEWRRIALLEAVHRQGKEWDVIAPRYGVKNPDPPWKSSLTGMCECLSVAGALPGLTDAMQRMPLQTRSITGFLPERELLALVHLMVDRGLVAEGDLASRMQAVRSRLQGT